MIKKLRQPTEKITFLIDKPIKFLSLKEPKNSNFAFLKKGPIPASLCLLSLLQKQHNFQLYELNRHRCSVWDSNPRLQGGRLRRIKCATYDGRPQIGSFASIPFVFHGQRKSNKVLLHCSFVRS